MKGIILIAILFYSVFTPARCAERTKNNNKLQTNNVCASKNCINVLNTPSINNRLKKFYKVTGRIEFIPIYHGVGNFVFLVKNNNKIICVLKCLPQRTIKELEEVSVITEKLRKKGFPIPKVDFFLSFPKYHNILLSMAYIRGNSYDNLQKKELEEIAKLMADLHLFNNIDNSIQTKYLTKEHFEKLFDKCKGWKHLTKMQKIYAKIDLNYLNNLPLGLNHGDFSFTNILFDNKNEIVGIIDFDRVSKTYLLTDLVRSQIFFGFDENGKLQEENIRYFLRAYNLYRPLTKEEIHNFYQHLKLTLIDMALAMCYYTYVKKDLDPNRFIQSKLNNHANPEVLFNKLLQIKDKSYIKINGN